MNMLINRYAVAGSDEARTTIASVLFLEPRNGSHDTPCLALHFPDRTPRDKLEAIAKAINDALAAAREVEAHGRD